MDTNRGGREWEENKKQTGNRCLRAEGERRGTHREREQEERDKGSSRNAQL